MARYKIYLFVPMSGILVIIPAFNEEESLPEVVRTVREELRYPVLVVDDASQDLTPRVGKESGATVLPLAVQLGAWGATQAGLRYAWRQGVEYAVTMDADGQHAAQHIPVLMKALEAANADIAIGSCPARGSRLRKIAWVLLKAISGLRREDVTSGFRVYNRRAIERLVSPEATMFEYQDVGVLVYLQSCGLKVIDVPVEMRPRVSGASRVFFSWRTVLYYMYYTLLLGLSKRRIRRPAGAA
jgi:hypothetical protein